MADITGQNKNERLAQMGTKPYPVPLSGEETNPARSIPAPGWET